MKYLQILRVSIRASFGAAAAYRANFWLSMMITLLSNILFPLVTILIYNAGASFPGWTFYEALLIQAVFTLSTAVAGILFNGVLWQTMQRIVEGTFEVVLIKPVDTLFYLMAISFQVESISLLAGGAVLFFVAVSHIGAPTLWMWLQFILLFAAGLSVMLGISLIMAATSFKWVGNSRIPEIFDSVTQFGRYPASIFPKAVQALSAFLIPVAMIGFFPAAALLGEADVTAFLSIIPCVLFGAAGVWLYKHMIHLYESVGG